MLSANLDRLSERIGDPPSPPGVRVEVVQSIMDRIGVRLAPEIFQFEVARVYQILAKGTAPRRLTEASLRTCHSYPVFQRALRRSGPADRVLILGCGRGLPGLDYEYPQEEWVKAWPDVSHVDTRSVSFFDLSDDNVWEPRAYDAVVTHSMVHYVYRVDLFFERIAQVLRPGGVYVMGKEVNARFGRTPELIDEADELRKEIAVKRRWKALFDHRKYYRRLGRLLGADPRVSLTEGVNVVLRRRLRIRAGLTPLELSRLIEIHRPLAPPSERQIGMQGLDVDFLSGTHLAAFDLDWFESSGYLGYQHHRDWPARWKTRDSELAARHEGKGVYFSACWRRRA